MSLNQHFIRHKNIHYPSPPNTQQIAQRYLKIFQNTGNGNLLAQPNKPNITQAMGSGNYIRLQTEKGNLEIEPAYSYEGLKGSTPARPMEFKHIFQQKLQLMDNA